MQIREDFKIFLLFVTAVATSVAAYATYRIYVDQTDLASLSLEAYIIEGTEEVVVNDTISLKLKKLSSQASIDEYELPLTVANHGYKDVEDITLYIIADGGELIVPSNWGTAKYADSSRYYTPVVNLKPQSAQKLSDLKIRIKSATHEVKLRWSIFASRTMPSNGTLIFRF
jgi:hypothetical protein